MSLYLRPLRRVYGKAKQGAGFGHTKVGGTPVLLRGLPPLVVTLSTPLAVPVIAASGCVAGPQVRPAVPRDWWPRRWP